MKYLLSAVYSVCLATSLLAVRADDSTEAKKPETPSTTTSQTAPDHKRPGLNSEQKAARKELVAKYDTNKDGKLDREERKGISEEDKAKMKKAGFQARPRKAVKKH